MRRLLILGCPGAGKSTLARRVARRLDLPSDSVDRFWNEFVPSVQPTCASDWCELPTRASFAVRRFGPRAVRDFERVGSLLAIALAARLESRIFGKPEDYLPVPSYFQVGMLMYRLLLAGRATFAPAWSDQLLVEAEAKRLSPALGMWLWGIFRFDILAQHCRSFDMVRSFTALEWQPSKPAQGDPPGEQRS